jgi:hypothetical protein
MRWKHNISQLEPCHLPGAVLPIWYVVHFEYSIFTRFLLSDIRPAEMGIQARKSAPYQARADAPDRKTHPLFYRTMQRAFSFPVSSIDVRLFLLPYM